MGEREGGRGPNDVEVLVRVELDDPGVGEQLGALDRNLERLDPLVGLPGLGKFHVELINPVNVPEGRKKRKEKKRKEGPTRQVTER